MSRQQRTHLEEAHHFTARSFFDRFRSIRIQLTGWYALTTSLILLLYGGLLYSTLAKMLPSSPTVDLQKIALQMVLMGVIILVIITASGYWLATKAMSPIRVMTQTAQHIGQLNLSDRIPVKSRDELGELAATFNAMLNRIEKAFTSLRQFAADASHELRTPLSTITIATNRILSQWEMPQTADLALPLIAAYKYEMEIVQAEAQQMTRIVNTLLTLARADTEQVNLTHKAIDVSEVILDVVERLAPLARGYGIELSLGVTPALPVQGDHWYLTSMVTNLIENGLKYTASTGTRVHIESGTEGGEWGWIRVQDDGPGIGEEHQPHIFERFYRVDPSIRSAGEHATTAAAHGSGLGLALVEWIVKAHGGNIQLQSTLGKGSCFEVRLPLIHPAMLCEKERHLLKNMPRHVI